MRRRREIVEKKNRPRAEIETRRGQFSRGLQEYSLDNLYLLVPAVQVHSECRQINVPVQGLEMASRQITKWSAFSAARLLSLGHPRHPALSARARIRRYLHVSTMHSADRTIPYPSECRLNHRRSCQFTREREITPELS